MSLQHVSMNCLISQSSYFAYFAHMSGRCIPRSLDIWRNDYLQDWRYLPGIKNITRNRRYFLWIGISLRKRDIFRNGRFVLKLVTSFCWHVLCHKIIDKEQWRLIWNSKCHLKKKEALCQSIIIVTQSPMGTESTNTPFLSNVHVFAFMLQFTSRVHLHLLVWVQVAGLVCRPADCVCIANFYLLLYLYLYLWITLLFCEWAFACVSRGHSSRGQHCQPAWRLILGTPLYLYLYCVLLFTLVFVFVNHFTLVFTLAEVTVHTGGIVLRHDRWFWASKLLCQNTFTKY